MPTSTCGKLRFLSSLDNPDFGTPAVDAVRRYYDVHTRRWLSRRRPVHTIHRAVWGKGVRTEAEAFDYINRLVLDDVRALAATLVVEPLHVLDLGCGVGASLIYLATHAPIRGTGVTISGVQAAYAAERIAHTRLADRVRCVEANFLELPRSIEPAHAAFSIEAFIHGPDPAAYFSSAAGRLLPGGLLIVCDDFLAARARGPLSRRDARLVDEFSRGWHANSLLTVAEADALATAAGFSLVKNVNLTSALDLRRPRDILVSLAMTVGRHLPLNGTYGHSLLGGNALQAGLGSGLFEFRYLVWRLP